MTFCVLLCFIMKCVAATRRDAPRTQGRGPNGQSLCRDAPRRAGRETQRAGQHPAPEASDNKSRNTQNTWEHHWYVMMLNEWRTWFPLCSWLCQKKHTFCRTTCAIVAKLNESMWRLVYPPFGVLTPRSSSSRTLGAIKWLWSFAKKGWTCLGCSVFEYVSHGKYWICYYYKTH